MLSRLEQAEILRQVKRITEESEKQSNAKALETFADFLKEF